jgi:hypothetical protein
VAGYGGYQRGLPTLTLDPITGEQVYTEGNDIEVSPNSQHTSFGGHMGNLYDTFANPRTSLLPYVLPYAMWAGSTAAGGAAAAQGASGATTSGTSAANVLAGTGAGAGAGAGAAAAGAGAGAAAGGGAAAAGGGWGSALMLGGKLVKQYLDGRAQNRAAEANNAYLDNQMGMDRYQMELQREQLDLQRRQYQQDVYDRNTRRAVYGGALQGVNDVEVTAPPGIPMGNVTGGLRPSAISNRHEIGSNLQRQALMGMMESGGQGQQPILDEATRKWIEAYQAANAPTPENYERMFEQARRDGINIGRPTRAGGSAMSGDKITSGTGVFDLITDEGGPNSRWQMSPDGYWVDGRPASDPMGGAPLPELPRLPPMSRSSRGPSGLDRALGIGATIFNSWPAIGEIFGRPSQPRPQMPQIITAPNPRSTMNGVRF